MQAPKRLMAQQGIEDATWLILHVLALHRLIFFLIAMF
jgi:hypothetical protein